MMAHPTDTSPSGTNIRLDGVRVRAMLHVVVHPTQIDKREAFRRATAQGFNDRGGTKGCKKTGGLPQQPHQLESYDPSSFTTAG